MGRIFATMLPGLVAAAFALAGGTPAAASDPAFGYWMVESGKAVVVIEPCGSKACGRLAWLAEPTDGQGLPKVDANNPDPELRARPLCGIRLISGLEREGEPGAWTDGAIYDGRKGAVYGVSIRAESANRLDVRGYLGLELFGSSQVWTRVAHDRGGCPSGEDVTAAR